jgi:hypothetical protein
MGIFKKSSLDEITLNDFQEAVFKCFSGGITSIAPLGYSGEDVYLFGTSRRSEVSIRMHSGDAKMLITDTEGAFIFYGGFDIDFGVEFVSEQYWQIFNKVKDKIQTKMPKLPQFKDLKVNKDMTYTEGFEMMKIIQARHFI